MKMKHIMKNIQRKMSRYNNFNKILMSKYYKLNKLTRCYKVKARKVKKVRIFQWMNNKNLKIIKMIDN